MTDKVNFTVLCPHCGKDLRGEAITQISRPSPHRTFFYTESDHQLAYAGWNLESAHCLDTLDGQAETQEPAQ